MPDPVVVCVLLTADRTAMTKRAVRCFERQEYKNKRLLILDTGDTSRSELLTTFGHYAHFPHWRDQTIGALRNIAVHLAMNEWSIDVIAHLDSDDWSHPHRIDEQVHLLESLKVPVVGYRTMLFWRTIQNTAPDADGDEHSWEDGEAWAYTHPRMPLGSSLCYRRDFWEKHPFKDRPRPGDVGAEYKDWFQWDEVKAVPSYAELDCVYEPMMVCTIHGGNSSGAYENLNPENWTRVPERDAQLREILEEA